MAFATSIAGSTRGHSRPVMPAPRSPASGRSTPCSASSRPRTTSSTPRSVRCSTRGSRPVLPVTGRRRTGFATGWRAGGSASRTRATDSAGEGWSPVTDDPGDRSEARGPRKGPPKGRKPGGSGGPSAQRRNPSGGDPRGANTRRSHTRRAGGSPTPGRDRGDPGGRDRPDVNRGPGDSPRGAGRAAGRDRTPDDSRGRPYSGHSRSRDTGRPPSDRPHRGDARPERRPGFGWSTGDADAARERADDQARPRRAFERAGEDRGGRPGPGGYGGAGRYRDREPDVRGD